MAPNVIEIVETVDRCMGTSSTGIDKLKSYEGSGHGGEVRWYIEVLAYTSPNVVETENGGEVFCFIGIVELEQANCQKRKILQTVIGIWECRNKPDQEYLRYCYNVIISLHRVHNISNYTYTYYTYTYTYYTYVSIHRFHPLYSNWSLYHYVPMHLASVFIVSTTFGAIYA